MLVRAVDQMILDRQVLIQKSHRLLAVRQDAPDLGRRYKNILRLFLSVEFLHRRAVQQVQFRPGPPEQTSETRS